MVVYFGMSCFKTLAELEANLQDKLDMFKRRRNDLIKRGMKFVGSTIIYSYLQAIGIVNDHEMGCFLRINKGDEK